MDDGAIWQFLVTHVGTPAQIAILGLALVALIKAWPILQKNAFDAKEKKAGRYEARIAHLEREVSKCHEEWTREVERLRKELWGEKTQRVAEQISLINLILQSVDAPELKTLLKTLEKIQGHMLIDHDFLIGTDVADAEGGQ